MNLRYINWIGLASGIIWLLSMIKYYNSCGLPQIGYLNCSIKFPFGLLYPLLFCIISLSIELYFNLKGDKK